MRRAFLSGTKASIKAAVGDDFANGEMTSVKSAKTGLIECGMKDRHFDRIEALVAKGRVVNLSFNGEKAKLAVYRAAATPKSAKTEKTEKVETAERKPQIVIWANDSDVYVAYRRTIRKMLGEKASSGDFISPRNLYALYPSLEQEIEPKMLNRAIAIAEKGKIARILNTDNDNTVVLRTVKSIAA